jgi:hypothetical protein
MQNVFIVKHYFIALSTLCAITSYPCEHAVRVSRLTHANMLCG